MDSAGPAVADGMALRLHAFVPTPGQDPTYEPATLHGCVVIGVCRFLAHDVVSSLSAGEFLGSF